MASAEKRIISKILADYMEKELEDLRDPETNGSNSIFRILVGAAKLHQSDVARVEREMEKEIVRLRKVADLPENYRDIHAELIK